MTDEGERLYAANRRRFWGMLGGLAAIGFVIGTVGHVMLRGDLEQASDTVRVVTGCAAILLAILVLYVSYRFFVGVDELEMADNLWGSLVGFYAYLVGFPTWWALWRLGFTPEPNDWAIFYGSTAVALAFYFYRKWRLR